MQITKIINARAAAAFAAVALGFVVASAQSFIVEIGLEKLTFNVIGDRTVEVSYTGYSDGAIVGNNVKGDLTIPDKVMNNGVAYTVAAIGVKAFSNADELTGVVMPATVKEIGDFAFEGCTSLRSIIFPGGQVKIGEGAFFRCNSLEQVTFGSDWTEVNLSQFRWSDALKFVKIPAKVVRLEGLKRLKHLESIEVEPGNTRFRSSDGLLYNGDGTTLYGCPRARTGAVKVAEGTTVILPGALNDCPFVTELTLPSTLQSMAMTETQHMKKLSKVTFYSILPFTNATSVSTGKPALVLWTANSSVTVYVPKAAKNAYKDVLALKAGDFRIVDDPSEPVYYVNLLPKNMKTF